MRTLDWRPNPENRVDAGEQIKLYVYLAQKILIKDIAKYIKYLLLQIDTQSIFCFEGWLWATKKEFSHRILFKRVHRAKHSISGSFCFLHVREENITKSIGFIRFYTKYTTIIFYFYIG